MKTFLTTILVFILLSTVSFSQTTHSGDRGYLLDSIIRIYHSDFGVQTTKKIEYNYNLMNQLTVESTYHNIFWPPEPDSTEWDLWERETINRNDEYDLVSKVYESKDNSTQTWMFTYKREYETNSFAQIETSFDWKVFYNIWEMSHQTIDSIKDHDIEQSILDQQWNSDSSRWEYKRWEHIAFLDNGLINVHKVMSAYISDDYDTSYVDVYDYIYYPDTIIIYEYMNGLKDIYKIFYNSDSSMKQRVFYRKFCDTCNYTALNKSFTFYDENQWRLSQSNYSWIDNENRWMFMDKSSWEYNDAGQETQYFDYMFDSISPNRRTYYEYNNNGLLESETYYPDGCDTVRFDVYYYYYTQNSFGIRNNSLTETFLPYPNPAHEQFSINGIDTEIQSALYRVYDITGRQVIMGKLEDNNNTVNISELVPGIYFVKVNIPNKKLVGRFIKY